MISLFNVLLILIIYAIGYIAGFIAGRSYERKVIRRRADMYERMMQP